MYMNNSINASSSPFNSTVIHPLIMSNYNNNNNIYYNNNNNNLVKKRRSLSLDNPRGYVKNTNFLISYIDNLIILFVNPKSGNEDGKALLEFFEKNSNSNLDFKIFDFSKINQNRKYLPIVCLIFNILDESDIIDSKKVLLDLINFKKTTNSSKLLKVLIGGGDGSIARTIYKFKIDDIDLNYLVFGHLALGTGNDFANSMGFNNRVVFKNNSDSLYQIIEPFYNARIGKVDIWKLKLILDEKEGMIIENSTNGKTVDVDENKKLIKSLTKSFVNYLSLGYDARVGYDFDGRRTKDRLSNMCIYFCEGVKKMCRHKISVPEFIESFTVYDNINDCFTNERIKKTFLKEENPIRNSQCVPLKSIPNVGEKIHFQFISEDCDYKKQPCYVLKDTPCSIIWQNITSYMGGVKNIWKNSKNRLGILPKNMNKAEEDYQNKLLENMALQEQKIDDHKIEVFDFSNGLTTGIENISNGHANKIYHGKGPIVVKFKKTEGYSAIFKDKRIYLNVDGEYWHIVSPKIMIIDIDYYINNGQVNILLLPNNNKN